MWMGLHGLKDVTRTHSQTLGSALFFFFKKYILKFIYLAVPGLSCGMRTLSCCMWGLVPGPGIKPQASYIGSAEYSPLDHEGSPCILYSQGVFL